MATRSDNVIHLSDGTVWGNGDAVFWFGTDGHIRQGMVVDVWSNEYGAYLAVRVKGDPHCKAVSAIWGLKTLEAATKARAAAEAKGLLHRGGGY